MNAPHIAEAAFKDHESATIPPSGHNNGNGHDSVPIHINTSPEHAGMSPPLANSTMCLRTVEPILEDYERTYPQRPLIDRQFIFDTAHAPVPSAQEVVREHHRQRFRNVFGPRHAKLSGFLHEMEANYNALCATAAHIEERLKETQRYLSVPSEWGPWTVWARCKVAAILVLSLLFILVDMNSVATTLMESGISAFQSPIRAWFFSTVPLGLALCLERMRDWLNPKLDRRIHALILTSLAVLSGVLWLWFFANTFPGIAKSPTEILNSLSLSPAAAAEGGRASNWLVFTGLAAAACIAAASWTSVEAIIEAHRVTRRVDNPDYLKTQSDLNHLRPALEQQGVLVTRTRKFIERIDKELQDYLAEVDNLYNLAEAAVAYQRDAYMRLHPETQLR